MKKLLITIAAAVAMLATGCEKNPTGSDDNRDTTVVALKLTRYNVRTLFYLDSIDPNRIDREGLLYGDLKIIYLDILYRNGDSSGSYVYKTAITPGVLKYLRFDKGSGFACKLVRACDLK